MVAAGSSSQTAGGATTSFLVPIRLYFHLASTHQPGFALALVFARLVAAGLLLTNE